MYFKGISFIGKEGFKGKDMERMRQQFGLTSHFSYNTSIVVHFLIFGSRGATHGTMGRHRAKFGSG